MYEKFLVIIPTYNESENIVTLIEELSKYGFNILIVDDNSPDNTFGLVTKHIRFGKNLFGILRTSDKGYGKSVISGFNYSLENNYEFMVQMDSDFSHSVEDLISMCSLAIENDLVIGSRYVQGGKIIGWNFYRKYLSKFANLFAKFATKSPINDLTTGFRVYSKNLVTSIDFNSINSTGYSFLVEIITKIPNQNFKIIEHPITFVDREKGKSKMNFKIIFESFINILKIIIN